jgi:hypothetical protein
LETITVREGGKALGGDNKAAFTIIGIAQREGLLTPEQDQVVEQLSGGDKEILEDMKRRLGQSTSEQRLTMNVIPRAEHEMPNSMQANSRSPRYSEQDLLRVFLRNDLYAFVQKVFETVNPGVAFSRNWSVEAVTHALQQVVGGKTTRLIINIPPRNLKSICASVALPAFLLGHNPTRKVICVSYSDELAAKFSNDCRAVMRSDWYQRTFPRSRIDKATEGELRTTERGYRLATSVGGTSPAGAAISLS